MIVTPTDFKFRKLTANPQSTGSGKRNPIGRIPNPVIPTNATPTQLYNVQIKAEKSAISPSSSSSSSSNPTTSSSSSNKSSSASNSSSSELQMEEILPVAKASDSNTESSSSTYSSSGTASDASPQLPHTSSVEDPDSSDASGDSTQPMDHKEKNETRHSHDDHLREKILDTICEFVEDDCVDYDPCAYDPCDFDPCDYDPCEFPQYGPPTNQYPGNNYPDYDQSPYYPTPNSSMAPRSYSPANTPNYQSRMDYGQMDYAPSRHFHRDQATSYHNRRPSCKDQATSHHGHFDQATSNHNPMAQPPNRHSYMDDATSHHSQFDEETTPMPYTPSQHNYMDDATSHHSRFDDGTSHHKSMDNVPSRHSYMDDATSHHGQMDQATSHHCPTDNHQHSRDRYAPKIMSCHNDFMDVRVLARPNGSFNYYLPPEEDGWNNPYRDEGCSPGSTEEFCDDDEYYPEDCPADYNEECPPEDCRMDEISEQCQDLFNTNADNGCEPVCFMDDGTGILIQVPNHIPREGIELKLNPLHPCKQNDLRYAEICKPKPKDDCCKRKKKKKKCERSDPEKAKDFLMGLVFLQKLIDATKPKECCPTVCCPCQVPMCSPMCPPICSPPFCCWPNCYPPPPYYNCCPQPQPFCNNGQVGGGAKVYEIEDCGNDTNNNAKGQNSGMQTDVCAEFDDEFCEDEDDLNADDCESNDYSEGICEDAGMQTERDQNDGCGEMNALKGIKECCRILSVCLQEFSNKKEKNNDCEESESSECSSESEESCESSSDSESSEDDDDDDEDSSSGSGSDSDNSSSEEESDSEPKSGYYGSGSQSKSGSGSQSRSGSGSQSKSGSQSRSGSRSKSGSLSKSGSKSDSES